MDAQTPSTNTSTTTAPASSGAAASSSSTPSGGNAEHGHEAAARVALDHAAAAAHQRENNKEPKAPKDKGDASADAAAKKFAYRKLTAQGEYEDEDWDEERVKSYLSDDYEEDYEIDGKTQRLPRHVARKYVQLGGTAYERMDQAKKITQAARAREEAALKDPLGWLDESMGHEFAEETIAGMQITKADLMAIRRAEQVRQLAELRASDPDKYVAALRERDEKIRGIREGMAKRKADADAQAQRRKDFAARIRPEIQEALKAAKMDLSDANVQRVFGHLQKAASHGHKLSMGDAAALARQDFVNDTRKALALYDGPQLLALLGGDLAKKIREAEVKRVERKTEENGGAPQQRRAPAAPANNGKRMSDVLYGR